MRSLVFALLAARCSALALHPASSALRGGVSPASLRRCAAQMSLVRQVNTAEFEKVAEKLGDKVRVLKIDADDEPVVASTLHVQGLPTVMFINDMSVVVRAEGALMEDELEALADHHLFGGPPPPQIDGVSK